MELLAACQEAVTIVLSTLLPDKTCPSPYLLEEWIMSLEPLIYLKYVGEEPQTAMVMKITNLT